jgi:hypothetical protein
VDFKINITDAVFCLDTFTGADYPFSAACSTSADCCEGLSCVDAVCVTDVECATEDEACTVSDDCCEGLICSADLCVEASPLPGKTIEFDLIAIHDPDSDSFDANCTDAACHGDRHSELAMDGATPAAHGTMLTLFPEGNDRCFACHTNGPNFLTHSAGALRQQVDLEVGGCALRPCHGPSSPHPFYVRE